MPARMPAQTSWRRFRACAYLSHVPSGCAACARRLGSGRLCSSAAFKASDHFSAVAPRPPEAPWRHLKSLPDLAPVTPRCLGVTPRAALHSASFGARSSGCTSGECRRRRGPPSVAGAACRCLQGPRCNGARAAMLCASFSACHAPDDVPLGVGGAVVVSPARGRASRLWGGVEHVPEEISGRVTKLVPKRPPVPAVCRRGDVE